MTAGLSPIIKWVANNQLTISRITVILYADETAFYWFQSHHENGIAKTRFQNRRRL